MKSVIRLLILLLVASPLGLSSQGYSDWQMFKAF